MCWVFIAVCVFFSSCEWRLLFVVVCGRGKCLCLFRIHIQIKNSIIWRFLRQECCNGLSLPPPGDLPHPGVKPVFPVSLPLQADSLPTDPSGKPEYIHKYRILYLHINNFCTIMYHIYHLL